MAIPGFSVKNIQKSKNQNMIAKSSYYSRQDVFDLTENVMKHPHAAKRDHVGESLIVLPPGAPEKYKDPSILWSEIQSMKYDNLGKAMILSLPKEASEEQRKEMVLQFVTEQLTSQNLICQVDFHDEKRIKDENNPDKEIGNNNFHAHILCSEIQMIQGEWAKYKSQKLYVNEEGNPLEKTNTPRLKNKRLQYDKDNNIIYKKGWKRLEFNEDGSPKLNSDGTPILTDIRTKLTDKNDPEHKQIWRMEKGKLQPQWVRKEFYGTTFSKYGWLGKLRENWQKTQNKYLRDHQITNEKGEIVQVDLRSYKKQDAEINDGLKRIPQIKVYDKDNPDYQEIIDENKKRRAHNELIEDVRRTKKEIQKSSYELDDIKNKEEREARNAQLLNPKKDWINIWVRFGSSMYLETSAIFNSTNTIINNTMAACKKRYNTLTDTARNNIEKKRIKEHYNVLKQLEKRIRTENLTSPEKVEILANEAWDKLSDQQKVAFVKYYYNNIEFAKNYARVLARKQNDESIFDGLDTQAPLVPEENTNQSIIQNTAKKICNTDDFPTYVRNAYASWDTASLQSPPQEIINVLTVYATADRYYLSHLSNEPWRITTTTSGIKYEPETIEQTAQEELEALETEEKQKQENARKAAEKDKAKRKAIEEQKNRQRIERQKQEQEHELRVQVQTQWQKFIPQFQVAVLMKDSNTVYKMAALIQKVYTKEQIDTKYKNAKMYRDQEQETIFNKYVDIHKYDQKYRTTEEGTRAIEEEYTDKRGKLVGRKINKAIEEHNQNCNEQNYINTQEYQQYSDEANFWHGMLHPEQAIRSNEQTTTPTVIPTEIVHEKPHTRIQNTSNRLPAPKGSLPPEESSGSDSGSGSGIQIGPNGEPIPQMHWSEQDDHILSEQERAEREFYKNWNPDRKGPSL